MYCHNCKKQIKRYAAFCPFCGAKQTNQKHSKWIVLTIVIVCLTAVAIVLFLMINHQNQNGQEAKTVDQNVVETEMSVTEKSEIVDEQSTEEEITGEKALDGKISPEDEREQINRYLSNFGIKYGITNFDVDNPDWEQAVDFAAHYLNLTLPEEIKMAEYEGFYYEDLSLNQINDVLKSFFEIAITPAELARLDGGVISYVNGHIYYDYYESDLYGRFSVMDTFTEEKGRYRIDFTSFDLDYEKAIANGGVPAEYYFLTREEAQTRPELSKVYEGSAIIEKNKDGNDPPYHMLRYFVRTGSDASAEETVPVDVSFQHRIEGGTTEFASIYGFSRMSVGMPALWAFFTDYYDISQYFKVFEIGRHGDRYYFVEDGTVKCLNVEDGILLWNNPDYGGGQSACLFADNAIYLCGNNGPDLFIMNYYGETLARIDKFDASCNYPSGIRIVDGRIQITFDECPDGKQHVLDVEPMDGSYVDVTAETDDVVKRLTDLCREYYIRHYGTNPSYIDCERQADGNYSLHLYEMIEDPEGGHTATYGWYLVDEQGVGKDTIVDEPVDLRN